MVTAPHLQRFLHYHHLPESYLVQAEAHFSPILVRITQQLTHSRPVIVGINGCQGSGKTTLADYLFTRLECEHKLNAVSISIDDFYLTKQERLRLAHSTHPLFATRGVPGTHDIELALCTLKKLCTATPGTTLIPRFNKACDDRKPKQEWDKAESPIDVIILEGWCVGSIAETETALQHPINTLEKEEDPEGHWRRFSNDKLSNEYAVLFQQIGLWVMLQAPSFDCVFQWRLEQEKKLAEKLQQQSQDQNINATNVMNESQIKRFIQFYQRITEHTLNQLPEKVDFLLRLDKQRNIQQEWN